MVINERQLQKLVEHDALKSAFDGAIKQRDDLATVLAETETCCDALLKLYPADAVKREDAGGKALKAVQDLVGRIKALRTKK